MQDNTNGGGTGIKNDILHIGYSCSWPMSNMTGTLSSLPCLGMDFCPATCTHMSLSPGWPTEGTGKMAAGRQAWCFMEYGKGQSLQSDPYSPSRSVTLRLKKLALLSERAFKTSVFKRSWGTARGGMKVQSCFPQAAHEFRVKCTTEHWGERFWSHTGSM